jgi:hypothetical protein
MWLRGLRRIRTTDEAELEACKGRVTTSGNAGWTAQKLSLQTLHFAVVGPCQMDSSLGE